MTTTKEPLSTYYLNSTCRVEIFTHPRGAKSSAQSYFSGKGSKQEVIACTTTKMALDPCGTFSFDIVPKTQDWLKIIRPNDWVDIYMDNGRDGIEELVMTGIVDTIRRGRMVVDPKTGASMTTITVAGRDVGKALLETDPFIDPKLTRSIDGIPFMNAAPQKTKEKIALPAHEMVQRFLDVYFDPGNGTSQISFQFARPDGSSANGTKFYQRGGTGVLALNMHSDPTLTVVLAALPNLSQSMWQLMDNYANRLVNQIFVEMLEESPKVEQIEIEGQFHTKTVVPGGRVRPTLFMRQFPFSKDDFLKMTPIVVNRNETWSDNIGLSSHEIKNWFRVDSSIFNTDKGSNIGAITKSGYLNLDSIRRNGLKRADYENMYSALGEKNSSALDSLNKMSKLLVEWHWNSEELFNGVIESRLKPEIRLPYRLDYVDRDEVTSFVIEGYTHTWRFQGDSRTSINVSRGVDRNSIDSVLRSFSSLQSDLTVTDIVSVDSSKVTKALERSRIA